MRLRPKKSSYLRWLGKRISVSLVALVFVSSTLVGPASTAEFRWEDMTPGTRVGPSREFTPVLLKGMTLYPDDPLRFDFIVDSGSEQLNGEEIKASSEKLVRYFMSGLTIPKSELWVNLSPYEGDRVITTALSRTELGQDLLIQDYLLKQLTSTLIYPEDDLGEAFWQRVHARAYTEYGVTELPIATFNKVWILPGEAVIAEDGHSVEVVRSTLKVMLDQDYLAMKHNAPQENLEQSGDVSELSAAVLRELIVPEIEKEVNTGENFAALRQIYHSLILAKWYKETITNGIMSRIYVDQNKVLGVDLADSDIKERVYAQYVKAFEIGVFDYVREEFDPYSQELIPRKYFSGGITQLLNVELTRASNGERSTIAGDRFVLGIGSVPRYEGDKAVLSDSSQNPRAVKEIRVIDLMFAEAQKERRWKRNALVPLSEAAEAIEEKFDGIKTTVDRSDIEEYLINTPGYPVEGNVHLAKEQKMLTGVSKGLEGVGVGRATFFEREDVQFQYPFVAPNDSEEVKDNKIASEKQMVVDAFEGSFQEGSSLREDAAYPSVIANVIAYIHEQIDERQEFGYRLVHELVRKSDEDFRFDLDLDESAVPDTFVDTLKSELLESYIPLLVEAHSDVTEFVSVFGQDFNLYQRLKLTRGAWAVLLTHPYGLERMQEYYTLLADHVTFQERHEAEVRKSEDEQDTKRIARLRREMDRINKRLKTLSEEIEGLQRSASAQEMMFFMDFLPKTLAKSAGEDKKTNALDLIRQHMEEMRVFFESLRERDAWNRNIEAINEAYTAYTFVGDHLDSHSYVMAYGDSQEVKDLKVSLELQRLRRVVGMVNQLYAMELLRHISLSNEETNGQFYAEILKGLDSEHSVITSIIKSDSAYNKFLDAFADFVERRIRERGATIESAMINFMAIINDSELLAAADGLVDLPLFATQDAFKKMAFQFMMYFSHTLKKETTKQETQPVVVFIDPNIEALTPNEVNTINIKYPNVVAIVEQGRSPHAINQFPLSVSGVEGIGAANIDEGDLTLVQGGSRGVGRVLVRPSLQPRVAAYQLSDDLERRRGYFNFVAAKPIKVGGRDYRSFISVGVNHKRDLRTMNTLGIPSVGLHRLELLFEDPYKPQLRNQEDQMAQEFEAILNEDAFSGDLGDGIIGLYIPRLDDVGGEKIPGILETYLKSVESRLGKGKRDEIQNLILTKYSGTAFYFYRDEAGERPFYEYGLRQLRALFRAYKGASNKRLGLTLPNVKVIDGVVSIDGILGMINEAKEQVAAALFQAERKQLEEQISELREKMAGVVISNETPEAERRAHEAQLTDLGMAQDKLTYFDKDTAEYLARQMKLFEGVRIGFYVEDVAEMQHYDEMVRKSDFIAIGTNDMTKSLFEKDFPKLSRFDTRYSHLFDEMQPRLLEVNWIMARVSARHGKPLLISGDWGDTVRWGGFIGTALAQRYGADVYPVSSPSKAARMRAYMRHVKTTQLINPTASEEEQGIFDQVFGRLETAYGDDLSSFKDVLQSVEDEYIAGTQSLRESIDPTIDEEARVMNEEGADSDKAVLVQTSVERDAVGGIDLNNIDLLRTEPENVIVFDPIVIDEILNAGHIDGFTPIIINVTPLPAIMPLLGGDSPGLPTDPDAEEYSARPAFVEIPPA